MKFTTNYIESLKPSGKMEDIREANGFGIRVLPSGVRTWFFIYRIDGKRRFMNLGHYPSLSLADARKRYRAAYDLYEQGKDPARLADEAKEERRKAPTVADLVTDYIEMHAKQKKRSWQEDERILNKDVVPAWGTRKAADITRMEVKKLLDEIKKRAPATANNTFQIIRKMFNFAVDEEILQHTPCVRIELPSEKKARSVHLKLQEIKAFWECLDNCAMSEDARRALKLILVTGQRPGEVAGIHAQEIDGRWWTLPVERQKVSKMQEHKRSPHRIYLTDLALDLLGNIDGKGYIFPSPRLDENGQEQSIDDHALAVAVYRAFQHNKLPVAKFTPHDLRRTAATILAELRVTGEVIDAIQNHVKHGMQKVYIRYNYDAEKQAALTRLEGKINKLISGEAGKVVTLPQRRAQG